MALARGRWGAGAHSRKWKCISRCVQLQLYGTDAGPQVSFIFFTGDWEFEVICLYYLHLILFLSFSLNFSGKSANIKGRRVDVLYIYQFEIYDAFVPIHCKISLSVLRDTLSFMYRLMHLTYFIIEYANREIMYDFMNGIYLT